MQKSHKICNVWKCKKCAYIYELPASLDNNNGQQNHYILKTIRLG
jgi:hypothetical protein